MMKAVESTNKASSWLRVAGVGAVVALARYTRAEVRTLLWPVVAVSAAFTRAADVVGRTFTLLHTVRHRATTIDTRHGQTHSRQTTTHTHTHTHTHTAASVHNSYGILTDFTSSKLCVHETTNFAMAATNQNRLIEWRPVFAMSLN